MTLIGGGTLAGDLAARVTETGLGDAVTLTGWLEPEEVRARMAQSDVLVLPTYREGFPNALIEAFAQGLPAIATAVGGIPDSLKDGDAGYLIAPRDSAALAAAMRRFIDGPALVERHSAAALEVVRRNHDFQTNCGALFAAVPD